MHSANASRTAHSLALSFSARSTRSACVLLVSLCALVPLALACASSTPRLRHKHEFSLSPGNEHHAGLAKALLIPLDYTNEKPVRGLEFANDRIAAQIEAHLESKGLEVERIDASSFKRIADAAHRQVLSQRKSGASGSVSTTVTFGDLVPQLLEELGHSSDLVIVANVVMRDAEYKGTRTIAWDGVTRRETVYGVHMSGGVPAASLSAYVFSREGRQLFSGYGGIEPVFRIDQGSKKYVQREDLFQDERNIKQGVCIAFYPWFGPEEYCAR